jgi:hypothetical protein
MTSSIWLPFFIEADWIGIGKQYPTKNTPYEVKGAITNPSS